MPSGGGPVTVCPNMKTVRQITHYVRPGATRIATSDDLWTVAFVNPDGTHVAVVKGLGAISVAGMPAGTYGVSYSTPDLLAQQLEDVTITAGQSLRAILPEPGVMTFYGKTAGALGRAVAASRERREDLLANERD
jgi:O-glycosyl hydrolase